MEKKQTKIKVEDLPEDLKGIPDDAEIVLNDHDPMEDDEFWDEQ